MSDDVFSLERSVIEVTSMHRPDPQWHFVDKQGHEHVWFDGEGVATRNYNPRTRYTLRTVTRVHDGWVYDEDGERREVWHWECSQCGEQVNPGYTADDCEQYIPGIAHYKINGVTVSQEEFERRWKEQHG